MKRYLLSLVLLCLVATGAHAYWQSREQVAISVGGAFVGPGDIFAFASWYGLRAYSSAYASGNGNIADIVDTATGGFACTIKAKTNGDADLTSTLCTGNTLSVTTFCTVTHAAGCSITKLYDQVSSQHLIQATLANMPLLIFSAVGSLPGMQFNGSSQVLIGAAATITQALPMTMSIAYKRTGNTGNFGSVFTGYDRSTGFLLDSTTNVTTIYAGNFADVAATDNSFHAVQGLFSNSGIASSIYLDGTLTGSLNNGNTQWVSCSLAMGDDNSGSRFFAGVVLEGGYVGSDQTANNSAVNSNQHAYWGF